MNNTSTLKEIDSDLKVAVNSIQRTLHVERLHVPIAFPADRIIPYDIDNLYPNKVKAIAQRSGTTMSAIGTLSAFLSGNGFAQMGTVINSSEQTLWDILRHICDSRAMFRGFALHFNYNMLGQITEINPVNFEFVRWSRMLNSFVVNPDWFRRSRRKDEVEYKPFNPKNVVEEIAECGGIDKYKGQLLYWIPNLDDYYTTCTWDSVLDDAQFEAEAKLYSLSSIQNDYSLSGLITYPKNITDSKEITDIKEDLQKDKGSANAGGVRVVSSLPSEGMTNWKWFTPMSRNNIDALHKNQKEDAKFNIYAAFRQPPILNGVATSGMFNQESFMDAFDYYNAATETERKEIESILNKIIPMSIWAGIGSILIQPKTFLNKAVDPVTTQAQQSKNETLTNLTGRQLQGVFRITRKYKKGELTFDQAATLLTDGFGFSEDQINIWLINDDSE